MNDDNQIAIAAASDIASLVALVEGDTPDAREAAAALNNLARFCAENQVAIAAAGGIVALMALVGSGTSGAREQAAGALCIMAVNAENEVAIAAAAGIAPSVRTGRPGTFDFVRRLVGFYRRRSRRAQILLGGTGHVVGRSEG